MASVVSSIRCRSPFSSEMNPLDLNPSLPKFPKYINIHNRRLPNFSSSGGKAQRRLSPILSKIENDPEDEVHSTGVKAALSMLNFYKREISPLLPKSCRYVPSCSEFSMIAYKKYGVVKGTVLTAWRLCRCNPLGGSGFDPPRWFGEERPSEE